MRIIFNLALIWLCLSCGSHLAPDVDYPQLRRSQTSGLHKINQHKIQKKTTPQPESALKPLKRVAVLKLRNLARLGRIEIRYLSNLLRQAAGRLTPSRFLVMTNDSIEALLPPDVDLERCEDTCPIKIGRTIQADWLLVGEVVRFGKGNTLRVSLNLHHVESGGLTDSTVVKGRDAESLEEPLQGAAIELFGALDPRLKRDASHLERGSASERAQTTSVSEVSKVNAKASSSPAVTRKSAHTQRAKAPSHPHLGKWHDAPRGLALWYICERDDDGRCGDEWSRYAGACYKVSDSRKSFDASRASCREQNAHLVTIKAAHENHYIAALSKRRACWIGLDEAQGTETWRWVSGRMLGEKGRWTGYTNWDKGEPNNHGGQDEDATFINFWGHLEMPNPLAPPRTVIQKRRVASSRDFAGKWYDAPRNLSVWYVCERRDRGTCQRAGWTSFDGACYSLSTSIKTYDAAAAACRRRGAHLTIIESAAENAFIQGLVKGRTVWIGLLEPSNSEQWIWANGAAAGTRGRWRGYTNWEQNEPNNHGGRDEDVAFMNFWGHMHRAAPWEEMRAQSPR